jgi:hypothetical protein
MPTVHYLLYLMELGAPRWRQELAARAVLAKLLITLSDDACVGLVALRESI